MVLGPVVALIPDIIIKVLQSLYFPSPTDIIMMEQKGFRAKVQDRAEKWKKYKSEKLTKKKEENEKKKKTKKRRRKEEKAELDSSKDSDESSSNYSIEEEEEEEEQSSLESYE